MPRLLQMHCFLHLKQWGANSAILVGQGCDGASVMSSSKNGVQAKIAKVFPNATYVLIFISYFQKVKELLILTVVARCNF